MIRNMPESRPVVSQHNKELFVKLKNLQLPKGSYIVFGSGALMVRGLIEGHDLDVYVSRELFDEFKSKEGWKIKPCNIDFYLTKDGIELWDEWRPGNWNLKELVSEAELFDDIPFVSLETTKKWKLLNGREKDLEHVKLIDKLLSYHQQK